MICAGTYDAGVVDKIVEPGVGEDRLDGVRRSADAVEVAYVHLDDVQGALRTVLQRRQLCRLLGRAARGDNEVV